MLKNFKIFCNIYTNSGYEFLPICIMKMKTQRMEFHMELR